MANKKAQIPIRQISGLQESLDLKLSTTGGTMAGPLVINDLLVDSKGSSGVSGFVLSSTGDGVVWISPGLICVKKISSYTAVFTDKTILCDTTSGEITINLPTAIGINGIFYNIKKIAGSNNVIIDAFGSELIDDSLTQIISNNNDCITVVSDNSGWHII